jgi:phage baseplate assembly protein W
MRRDYGSRLFELVDAPYSPSTKLELIAATAEALMIWEPRIQVDQVSLQSFAPSEIIIDLEGTYLPDGSAITLGGIEVL